LKKIVFLLFMALNLQFSETPPQNNKILTFFFSLQL
jgi:hypothetical protein